MKALIEFDLPEDERELLTVVHAGDYLQTLHEFREWLRALNKHGHPYTSADEAVSAIYMEYCQRTQNFIASELRILTISGFSFYWRQP